ncbi:MAG: radical SAM protein [Polyangiaceae bacterium]|nr:radical SAM protein [Polyangiaceae bacterium]
MNAELFTALEITRSLVEARLRRRRQLYLVHSLTARCNARCGFCAWNPDFYDANQQLSTEGIERLYTEARAEGFLGVSVWGGEPLLHPDFHRVMRHAKALGLATNMVTNGYLLEKKLDAVLETIDRLCISLDHPSSKHDELRGLRGLFDRIVASTREVRRRAPKKPITFVYTLQRANVSPATLRETAALLRDLGVLGIFNGLREEAATEGDAPALSEFAAPQGELRLAFDTLAELKREGFPILNSFTHLAMMREGPPVYRCHWPKLMLPIEANGDVVDCMHWGTRPLGSLKTSSLHEILASPRLRELAGPAGEACHKCVSIHRIEISKVWDGELEPALSWAALASGGKPRGGGALVRLGARLARTEAGRA